MEEQYGEKSNSLYEYLKCINKAVITKWNSCIIVNFGKSNIVIAYTWLRFVKIAYNQLLKVRIDFSIETALNLK